MGESSERLGQLSPLQRAVIAVKELRAKLEAVERTKTEPLAVVGLGCRFPGGADDPAAFWQLLADGRAAITLVPSERWDADAYFDTDPDAPGKTYSRHGGFIHNVDQLDAAFFGIAPGEAAAMDPQQRLVLETCWQALENAGLAPDRLAGSRAGVLLGISSYDYALLTQASGGLTRGGAYTGLGNATSVAAGRVSFVLGLQGPCLAVDTACSSSLVAVHLACQSLRNGECHTALAAGVSLMLIPETTVALSKMRALSPEGHCKTFDAKADGYVRGEGCGVVVLKRLSDALADGDTVLAVIRGSAVNQDGRSSNLTAPNGPTQQAVIKEALTAAGVEPALREMGRRYLPEADSVWLPSLRRDQADWEALLQSLAELYLRGAAVDWVRFDRDYPRPPGKGRPTRPIGGANLNSPSGEIPP